jgi:hypothetical protein
VSQLGQGLLDVITATRDEAGSDLKVRLSDSPPQQSVDQQPISTIEI